MSDTVPDPTPTGPTPAATATPAAILVAGGRSRRRVYAGLSVLAAAGVLATAGCSGMATPSAAAPPAAAGHHGGHARRGIAGQISAMNGSNWTVTTAKGAAYTVSLTPTTKYGTPAAPATESQFSTGERVRVIGQPSGTSVTAKRVAPARERTPGQIPAPTSGAPAEPAPAQPATTTG